MADETPHVHLFRAAKCQYYSDPNCEHTVVLEHCACGEFRWTDIPGNWSVEDFLNVKPQQTDEQFLKQVGIIELGCRVRKV